MPSDIPVRHVYSSEFRTSLIDNAVVTILSDLISDRIVISLTRMENRTISEKARKEDSGAITLHPGVTPDGELVKIIEFSAEMRPDQVMGLVAAIRIAFSQIPADRRSRYNIPDEFIGAGKTK
jgi:hypothetical protein